MGGARYAARSKPESGVLGGGTKWACAEGVVVERVREDGGLRWCLDRGGQGRGRALRS